MVLPRNAALLGHPTPLDEAEVVAREGVACSSEPLEELPSHGGPAKRPIGGGGGPPEVDHGRLEECPPPALRVALEGQHPRVGGPAVGLGLAPLRQLVLRHALHQLPLVLDIDKALGAPHDDEVLVGESSVRHHGAEGGQRRIREPPASLRLDVVGL
eukprot:8132024-Lingulodinium_polyedra.AAC.1